MGFAFALLFFLSAVMFGQMIASSVIEEKQSRLVEIIATAIPLRQLLAGKVIGNSAIALAQLVLFRGRTRRRVVLQYSHMLGALSGAVGWFIAFFTVGFVALACVFAVDGALASRTEDLQATTAPVTTVLMLVYFASLSLEGTAERIASFVPIASVISMPTRILRGDALWWEPVVALAITVAFAAVTVIVGEKVYRRSLMQTRGRLSWRQALATEGEQGQGRGRERSVLDAEAHLDGHLVVTDPHLLEVAPGCSRPRTSPGRAPSCWPGRSLRRWRRPATTRTFRRSH